jgi:hypothetical protein
VGVKGAFFMREENTETVFPPVDLRLILGHIGSHVKEISYHHLRELLKRRYGLRCNRQDVEGILGDSQRLRSTGWGRGEDRLFRLSEEMKGMIRQGST